MIDQCVRLVDFVSGHAQQNGEQLNNLLKTLHGYYFRPNNNNGDSNGNSNGENENNKVDMRHKSEFICYFILFQLGNLGEVSKYLQKLPRDVLGSKEILFALKVWGALGTGNYAKFFRLLEREATLLQGCLMHRYISEVRLSAVQKMCRSFFVPNREGVRTLLPLQESLLRSLLFESEDAEVSFLRGCGLRVEGGGVVVDQHSGGEGGLPRDKNGQPILPKVECSVVSVLVDNTTSF